MTARPATICRELLAALEASEGRRRRRKRDTTPDAIGLGIKRALLEGAVADDPPPAAFEGWLLERCLAAGGEAGATRAMALEVLAEWRLASSLPEFGAWLDRGAPSDDGLIVGGPDMAPHTPQRSEPPRETRGGPRSP
ncbi:MAG TPA: hypothetical protein VE932_16550 [Patescibacteria group bacterium]|nr:hypothetical protein [Patescibacteria group bacterium]